MPPRKAQSPVNVVVQAASERDEEERSIQEQEVESVLEHVDAETLTKVEARIFRRHPATGNRESHLDTVDAELITADFLKDNYGGGSYRIQFIGPMKGKAGKPGRGIVRTARFDIDASIPPTHPRARAQQQDSLGPGPSQGSTQLDMAVVSMLATMMQQMQAGANQQAQAQQSLVAMQMQMMKDHSAMLQAQLTALADKKPDRDPLELVERITSLIKPEPSRTIKDELETLQMLRELTGDSTNETSWLDVVKEVGPSLLNAAAKRDGVAVARRGAVAGTIAPNGRGEPGPSPVALGSGEAPTQAPAEPNEVTNPNLRFVAPIVPKLIKWATQGRSPELCAEWQLSEVPPGFWPMLREQLGAPTLLDEVVQAFPASEPFKPWIAEFRDAMLGLMSPEGADDEDEEGDDEQEE